MFNSSVIAKTRQTWKFASGIVLMVCGCGVMIFGLQHLADPSGIKSTFAGMGLGAGAAIITCLLVRCPYCGMRWIWAAIKSQEYLQWMNWLMAQRFCPSCGRDPATDKLASVTLPFPEQPDQDNIRAKEENATKEARL